MTYTQGLFGAYLAGSAGMPSMASRPREAPRARVPGNPYLRTNVDYVALLAGQRLRATRPLHFFRPDGPMPDALELPLTIPAELGPAAAVVSELRDRVRAVELEREAERTRTGRRVLGRHAVLVQSWREHPASVEPRRNLRPQVASRSKWARIEALLRNRAFVIEYASARDRWRTRHGRVFPPGTYWVQRFASVVVET
jgi:hypothetical protein